MMLIRTLLTSAYYFGITGKKIQFEFLGLYFEPAYKRGNYNSKILKKTALSHVKYLK